MSKISARECGRWMRRASSLTVVLTALVAASAAWANLEVRVEANPDPARPGETVNVSIHVTNTGSSALNNVLLDMVVPQEVDIFATALASSGASCSTLGSTATCQQEESVIWSLGTLAAGNGRVLSIPPQIRSGASAPANGTQVSFIANAIANGLNLVSDTALVEVQSSPFLDLGMVESESPVAAGDELTYTLSFGHTATSRLAPGTVLSMPIPAGTTFVSASDGGSLVGSTVEWALGTLSPGQAGRRELTVAVDPGLANGDLLEAQASIADTDSPAQQARAQALTRIDDAPPLQMALEVNPDPAENGETVLAQITVTNTTAFPRFGVVARMRLPDLLDVFSRPLASNGGSCSSIGSTANCDRREEIVWSLGDLDPGKGRTVSVPPIVAAAALEGELIRFDAVVQDDQTENAAASQIVEVQASPFLDLGMVESESPVAAGDELTYTLSFGHTATSRLAPGTVLSMPIPAGTTFVSASDGGSLVGSTVEWALGTLSPGQAGRRELTVAVDPGLANGDLLEAQASIADTDSPAQQARAQALTRIDDAPPLQMALEVNPDPAENGETVLAQLTVTNTTAFPRFGVVARMRLPDLLNVFSRPLASNGGSCGSIGSTATCDRREEIVWSLGDLEPGKGRTVSVPPIVAAAALEGELIRFDAVVQDDQAENAAASQIVEVQASPFLDLGMVESESPVAAGDELTYTLSFGHTATSRLAPGTVLSMPIPAGTTFVSASDGGSLVGSTVEWALGTLSPGQAGRRELTVAVDPGLANGDLLEAQASIADTDSPAQQARAQALTRIDDAPPLQMALEVNPDPAENGETVLAQLTVTNTTAFPRFGVVARMRLPDLLNVFSRPLASNGGSCGSIGSTATCDRREEIVWSLGDLEPGKGRTVSVPPIVAAAALEGELIRFDAVVQDDQAENAAASQIVEVQAISPLGVSIIDRSGPASPGDTIDYTIDFGFSAVAGIAASPTLRAKLPAGTSFVSASDGGVLTNGSIEWSLDSIPSGQSGRRTFTVGLLASVQAGDLVSAEAAIVDESSPARQARSTRVTRVSPGETLRVSVDTTPDVAPAGCEDSPPFEPGCTQLTTIEVENTSDFPAFNVVLELRMPDGFDTLSASAVTGGGTCNTVGSTATCERRERIIWSLGTLNAGQIVTVTLPPTISSNVPLGEIIRYVAVASDTLGQSSARETFVVPEPALIPMLAMGIGLLAAAGRRHRIREGLESIRDGSPR